MSARIPFQPRSASTSLDQRESLGNPMFIADSSNPLHAGLNVQQGTTSLKPHAANSLNGPNETFQPLNLSGLIRPKQTPKPADAAGAIVRPASVMLTPSNSVNLGQQTNQQQQHPHRAASFSSISAPSPRRPSNDTFAIPVVSDKNSPDSRSLLSNFGGHHDDAHIPRNFPLHEGISVSGDRTPNHQGPRRVMIQQGGSPTLQNNLSVHKRIHPIEDPNSVALSRKRPREHEQRDAYPGIHDSASGRPTKVARTMSNKRISHQGNGSPSNISYGQGTGTEPQNQWMPPSQQLLHESSPSISHEFVQPGNQNEQLEMMDMQFQTTAMVGRILGFEADSILVEQRGRYEAGLQRWQNCTIDEWVSGADEIAANFTKIFDFAKARVREELSQFTSMAKKIDKHKVVLNKREQDLEDVKGRLIQGGASALGW